MRQPPLKAFEAVLRNRVDHRTRRLVTHFRPYFRCFNAKGEETTEESEIERVELTQRGKDYWYQHGGPQRQRIPELVS
jgi:hypothetical protein